jgi:hypothetical protein
MPYQEGVMARDTEEIREGEEDVLADKLDRQSGHTNAATQRVQQLQ